jgi:asparagine synthase (glutamine-hydrolysing)
MSGFFGIFNPKGGVIKTEAFEQMKAAAGSSGNDGIDTYVDENIAMGHVMLRVSPESQFDQQPLKSTCGNYILVGHFRLDYRDELGDKLGLTQSELENSPDSRLVMMAYQKWKEKIVYHLDGDWAFVLFDLNKKKLLLLKDIYGYSAIFYTISNDILYFSSYPHLLDAIADLNLKLDYSQILKLGKLQSSLDTGSTIISGLYSIMSGNSIVYSSNCKVERVEVPNYNFKNANSYKYLEDVTSDFHNNIVRAINNRLCPQKNGLLLSAGLDSSLIADYINTIFKIGNEKLKTFTSFPKFKNNFTVQKQRRVSEDDHVREFTRTRERLMPYFIDASEIDFNYFLRSNKFRNFYNPIITPNSFWVEGINHCVRKEGIKLLLSGQMGNYIVSWNAPSIAFQYFIDFKFFKFCSHIYSINRSNYKNIITAIKVEFIKPLFVLARTRIRKINKTLFGYFDKIKNNSKDQDDGSSNLRIPKFENVIYDPKFIQLSNSKKLREQIFKSSASRVGIKAYLDAENFGFQSADPYVDRKLVEFSFNLDESYFNREGQPKFIYWCLMKNKISEEIRYRVGAFPQSYDCALRLANDPKFVEVLMEENLDPELNKLVNEMSLEKKLKFLDLKNYDLTKLYVSAEILKYISIIYIHKFLGIKKKN